MRRPIAIPLVTLLALAACGAETGGGPAAPAPLAGSGLAPGTAAPPAPTSRDDGRLPATVTPQRYALALRVDPTQTRFSGTTSIEVAVPEPTWNVVLHARDMSVSRAVAHVAGAPDVPATASTRLANGGVVPDELVLTFSRPLPQGPAILEIAYDAPFAADLAGLYRVKEGDAWYAYTQFEATDARRAFPCFDEPGFKTAYDVSITAPRGMIALANAPETSHEDAPDGTVVHHFDTSRPLPSYLVAFAVGDFDVVQGQTSPFPIRAVTPKGKGGLTSLALEASAALVGKLGEYFDVRYPYPKLDVVAVPDFAAGAMENPGLVTFREELLEIDPARATTTARRRQARIIAHEFAHQWFGDLVTAKWWDDIWLNEGMATWAQSKMVDAWKPSFGATTEEIAGVQHVMDTDALHAARAVRQPVHSVSEAIESFDGLTYEKGAAVLRMLESWLGPDIFRRGVQRYVHASAWGIANANDLFDALDYVSAQKVGAIASGFLDHPGVPSVLLRWKCGGSGGKLELRESEWRPLGGGGDPPRSWTLPVCVASEGQKGKNCFTLGADPIARDLGGRCPAWLYPNADEAGYYRFVLDRAQLLALARASDSLDPVDRLGLVSNAWAEVRQGALDASALLEVLPTFDGETNRFVIDQLTSVVEDMDRSLVDDGDRPAFQRWVAARFAGKKAMLGWVPAKKEDDDRALARQTVLFAMGHLAHDAATLAEAEKYAQQWLKDPTSVPSDTATVAVPLASIRAGAARLDDLRAAAEGAKTPQDRIVAIRAMAWFDDPAVLRKAFDVGLTDEIRLGELWHLFGAALGRREAAPVLFTWEKENWGKIRARVPGSLGGRMLVGVAGAVCSKAEYDDAKAFFGPATVAMEGVKRPLEERLEQASLCAALREHGAGGVAAWLKPK
jgi:aminopeptidase N